VVAVERPAPVSCIPPDYRPPPVSDVTRQALLAAPDAAARYQMLAGFWTLAVPELALDAKLIQACQVAAQPRAGP
jgi:hypothetical protein